MAHSPTADRADVVFAGLVADPQGTPIQGAVVTVNGRRVHADVNGDFEVLVLSGERIAATAVAEGFHDTCVRIAPNPAWCLTDGTPVVVHRFTLDTRAPR
ncbi:hypothetical protein AB0I54_28375 [Streptomyces sp. NPDC050625]|uniref:hypothetical protein n=1 Tax=Streptomyces sp. NPDC050625 TaxID=3154629 RepID=UPI0034400BC7